MTAATRLYLLVLQVAAAAGGVWLGSRIFDAVAG